jgi:hypothetical protein
VGPAAEALDSDGHFILPLASVPLRNDVIDEQRAAMLALAFVKTFSGSLEASLQAQRDGAPVRIGQWTAATRVEFADSPYDTLGQSYTAATRRFVGPYFVVRLLDGIEPVASVAVSASSTHLTIVDGKVVYPSESGNEFRILGNPPSQGFLNPISPEEATRLAAQATGAKVTSIPKLLTPDWPFSTLYSRWVLRLERPIRFQRIESGQIEESQIVYVGLRLNSTAVGTSCLLLPRIAQPVSESISDTIQIRLKEGAPVLFEEVRAVR